MLYRGRKRARRTARTARSALERLSRRRNQPPDALSDALLRLRRAIDEQRLEDLPLAWFRVDEAKAAAVWYSVSETPAHEAVLPEEQALAEHAWRLATGRAPIASALLAAEPGPLPMVHYRLLVAHLPAWTALGGRRAAEAIRLAYGLMKRAPDVLSPYGRWLLATAVCRAARDVEEEARQTERFRLVTADHHGADGALMAFCGGGEFELPLPLAVGDILDLRDIPTTQEAFKRDAPKDIARLFMSLTEGSRRVFMRSYLRREQAYANGYPWSKPPWVASEGWVFVRQKVVVPAFFIDRRPVSNGQFYEFTRRHAEWRPSHASRFATERGAYLTGWLGDRPPWSNVVSPVTGVGYQACRAYVAATGKQLPSEAQWVLAMLGGEPPEPRLAAPEERPGLSAEEMSSHVRRAAERGLALPLAERLHDFDGELPLLPWDFTRVLVNPLGPPSGSAHLWRGPITRGRLPDTAGDPNLTFRGVLPASLLWTGSESAVPASPPFEKDEA
jgi:hypothetical protein